MLWPTITQISKFFKTLLVDPFLKNLDIYINFVIIFVTYILITSSLFIPFLFPNRSEENYPVKFQDKKAIVTLIFGEKYKLSGSHGDSISITFKNQLDSSLFYLNGNEFEIPQYSVKSLVRVLVKPFVDFKIKGSSESYRLIFIFIPKMLMEKIKYIQIGVVFLIFYLIPTVFKGLRTHFLPTYDMVFENHRKRKNKFFT